MCASHGKHKASSRKRDFMGKVIKLKRVSSNNTPSCEGQRYTADKRYSFLSVFLLFERGLNVKVTHRSYYQEHMWFKKNLTKGTMAKTSNLSCHVIVQVCF